MTAERPPYLLPVVRLREIVASMDLRHAVAHAVRGNWHITAAGIDARRRKASVDASLKQAR